jgi:CheY-like chemotaxis protein
VLLIEDDERLCRTISAFLEARGYDVECAEDAPAAFELLPEMARPCLVLVDLLTIRIDRDKLLGALGHEDRLATLPVVMTPLSVPELFSRPAALKRPVDLGILGRFVDAHCCGGNLGGLANHSSSIEPR